MKKIDLLGSIQPLRYNGIKFKKGVGEHTMSGPSEYVVEKTIDLMKKDKNLFKPIQPQSEIKFITSN